MFISMVVFNLGFTYINKKKFFFLFIVVIFCVICFSFFYRIYPNFNVEDKIIGTRIENNDFLIGMKVNKKYASYNSLNHTFYVNGKIDNIYSIVLYSPYSVKYLLKKVDFNNYKVLVYSDKYYVYRNISFSNIPIMNISTFNQIINKKNIIENQLSFFDSNIIGEIEQKVNINLYDYNFREHDSYENNLFTSGSAKIRGASSRAYLKKSYKLKTDKKTSVLGLSEDNDFVLDALYVDKSKVRNKLSSDMWNLLNNNQNINNDLKSQFVDLYVDMDYCGLYVMKNNVDTHVTNLSETGLIIKSIDHSNSSVIDNLIFDSFDIIDGVFLNMEIKYYNEESFNSFIRNLHMYYSGSMDYNAINSVFDFDNFINYKIFVMLISGEDNLTKNQYMSMQNENSKILITPWDMDLTWGLSWSDSNSLFSDFSMDSSTDFDWIYNNITKYMDDKTLFLMKQRYLELRKDIITMDTINNYLNSYKELLVDSGAASRDSERWYEYDVEYEIEQIREWASRRIQFLDEYFK